jgi:hypothetical protein
MAQINFFKGDHSRFFDAETGAWKTDFEDAICFDITQEEIWVNGVSFGTNKDLKTFINEGKIVTGVAQDGFKITFSFAEGEDVVVDFSATASATANGLMSSGDKKNLDKLAELIDADDDSGFKMATSSSNGLMSAAHVSLLELLSGTGGGEGDEDPSIVVKVANLEGDVTNIKGDITTIKEDIGEWTSTTESITEAIGGLNDSFSDVDGRVEALEGQIQGLSGAMHFAGVETSVPTFSEDKWSNEKTYSDGDVILVGAKEYICSNNVFVEFGDAGDLITTEQLGAVEDKVDANSNALEELTKRVAANEGNISTVTETSEKNKSDLEALTARVKANEDKFINYAEKSALEELTNRVKANEDGISAINAALGEGFSEESTVASQIAALVEADKEFATKTELISALSWQ